MSLSRSSLEGHEDTLIWADFQGTDPSGATDEAAFASARFDMEYDIAYDERRGSPGYYVDHVQVRVEVERAIMWSSKKDRTDALLQHEQGHYDIVALLGRDLYNELMGWASAKKPKRFRDKTTLKDEVNRVLRRYKKQAVQLAGSSTSVGVYDSKTKHGKDEKAQAQWAAALAAARKNGTLLSKALSAVGGGAAP
jgi:hypothetical protein